MFNKIGAVITAGIVGFVLTSLVLAAIFGVLVYFAMTFVGLILLLGFSTITYILVTLLIGK